MGTAGKRFGGTGYLAEACGGHRRPETDIGLRGLWWTQGLSGLVDTVQPALAQRRPEVRSLGAMNAMAGRL